MMWVHLVYMLSGTKVEALDPLDQNPKIVIIKQMHV